MSNHRKYIKIISFNLNRYNNEIIKKKKGIELIKGNLN